MKTIFMAMLAAILCACTTVTPQAPATSATAQKTVYVIRHLQKGAGDDPSLTAEGAANAQALAGMLKAKGIVAAFATPTRRAMETAAPLAAQLGFDVTPYDPRDPAALAAAIAAASGSVLVVGHSNTVPDLVAQFGGTKPGPLGDGDYGMLFAVGPGGSVEALQVR
ncbi:histidine phosphatase family protein [Sphingomonas sabuli]|uniref:Histidine phosphatase family protein n=1 Tax=Sphingomonas sabuli TaxID=2764186 RepID=A0A7G9L016_9SPHN|nr:histidine phosphatase family protein [Sphingomonas sabuli]QNM81965.1 histidine phosphatase family protein [Sphingomonas sabuli]